MIKIMKELKMDTKEFQNAKNEMQLLVIGASGYIGSHIYSEAKKRNINVVGTMCEARQSELVKFNIKFDNISDVINKIDANGNKYVIICSAISAIDSCFVQYKHAYDINVTSTIRLLDQLNKQGFKSVFLSSDNVFDGESGYYTEDDVPKPINKYGQMKAEVEKYILTNHSNDCIMRISKIIGDKPHAKNIFTQWQKSLIEQKEIACIKNQIFSPTDVMDIVNCFFIVIERNLSGLYNVCNAENFERFELAYQFIKKYNPKTTLTNSPLDTFNFMDSRPLKTYMSNDRFVKKTGYHFENVNNIIKNYWLNQGYMCE